MAISTTIPLSWKLPLFWAVVDGSRAGNLTQQEPALLVGQYYASNISGNGSKAGVATANVPIPIGSVALGQRLFGQGSMLDRMIQAFFLSNTTQLLYAIPIPDPSAGVQATGNIQISTAPTASGVLTIYIAGQKVQITVFSTDSAATVATNLIAAINAIKDLPVTAVVNGTHNYQVDLTCTWKGDTGNDITIIPNYRGVYGSEALPTGLTLTISAMASGNGQPDFTSAISAIQMQVFDYVSLPYTDTGSMASWATEYGFGQTGRWSFTRQQYGFCLGAYRNDYADALVWGLQQNAPVLSTLAIEQDAPTPVWEWSAAYTANASLGFTDDPARPLQTLELTGVLPARLQNRFTQAQINNLTGSGFAIQAVAPDGAPMILREATQYQVNQYGQGDTAFNLLTTLATLALLLRRMRQSITSKFPRVKLVQDGTKLGPGQAAVSPSDIRAELVSEFAQAEFDGLVQNRAAFISSLLVEIDDNDPNRANVLWAPQLAGQLRQFDVLAQFRLLTPVPVT